MKWIINNYKDNFVEESYLNKLSEKNYKNIKLILCPNDKQLSLFKTNCFILGSQDMEYYYQIEDLVKHGVKYTILGHSDTRKRYKETNEIIHEKIKKLVKNNICPILCIGEEENNNVKEVIDKELEVLKDIKLDNIMIAYEPVWAIGTGKIPDTKKLEEILLYIKDKVVLLSGINPILIYGGSVNENTIEKLKHVNLIDGYLIGSASLNINSLETIIEVVK